jgi:hypothetical protein
VSILKTSNEFHEHESELQLFFFLAPHVAVADVVAAVVVLVVVTMNLLGIKKDRVSCLHSEIRKIQFRLNKIPNPCFVIAFHLFCTVERKLPFQCFFK